MPTPDTTAPHRYRSGRETTSGTASARTGNRQLNAAIHRIAITQAHYYPDAKMFLERRRAAGDTKAESIRVLKRRLSDVVFKALMSDAQEPSLEHAFAAA